MSSVQSKTLRRVALIGSYSPRQCGIATFSGNLLRGIEQAPGDIETFAVPVNDIAEGYRYPNEVWYEIEQRSLASYRRAADFLNLNDVDIVSVQHEFGLFGGPAGGHILQLIRQLRIPVVTTFHTILQEPSDEQRVVMDGLIEASDLLVTMTERGRQILHEVYHTPADRIRVIAHGIPDVPFVDPSFYKDKFDLAGQSVLLTFGLIGPGKGLEQMIDAMPMVLTKHPNTTYVILGATHPQLKREQGEIYRIGLQQRVEELGVQEQIVFHNRFVSDDELNEFLGASEIYITPYLNEAQICSGSLAYAMGSGKAVVSTPYWHAAEALADGRGRLVPFNDSPALAQAVIDLLDHPTQLAAMRKRAYLYGRDMTWPLAARAYLQAFSEAQRRRAHQPQFSIAQRASSLPPKRPDLPLIRLDHVRRLTDSTGIVQHAVFSIPNFNEGYCVDDNARALILTELLPGLVDSASVGLDELRARYMAFLQFAFNPKRRRFRNMLGYNRVWLEEAGSEDSHGRALWALGTTVGRSEHENEWLWAGQLFERALPPVRQFSSPRAWAFTLLGIDAYLTRFEGDRIARQVRAELAGRLLEMYRSVSAPDWLWFEDRVTYCNAVLPHALLVTADAAHDDDMAHIALESLQWLVTLQTSDTGHFIPIGSEGFYKQGSVRACFDQQPIEAHATVSATLTAWRLTGQSSWRTEAQRAFDWFLGRNDLGLTMYDPQTAGCFDGLHPDGVNRNQGAESSLAFLLALSGMHQAEHDASLKPSATAVKPVESVSV